MSWAEDQSWYGLEESLDFNEYLDSIDIRSKYKYDELTGEILWETKTFDLIPISQMTTTHIINCIRMILKSNKRWRGNYLPYLQTELNKRNNKI